MCNTPTNQRGLGSSVESFSTFHLFRTCNRLMLPTDPHPYYDLIKEDHPVTLPMIGSQLLHNDVAGNQLLSLAKSPLLDVIDTRDTDNSSNGLDTISTLPSHKLLHKVWTPTATIMAKETENSMPSDPTNTETIANTFPLPGNMLASRSPLPAFEYIAPNAGMHSLNRTDFPLLELNRVGLFPSFVHRRPRGEKRPIPEEQKDEKYYERRKRNNEAAKKSRDARKIREDRIAFRAALLEQENSLLRAQLIAVRGELHTLRQILSSNPTSVMDIGRRIV